MAQPLDATQDMRMSEKLKAQQLANPKPPSAKTVSESSNLVGTHYKICRKIGEGSFGIIYEGLNLLNNTPIAVKFEPRKCDAPQLRDEYKTYKIMAGTSKFA